MARVKKIIINSIPWALLALMAFWEHVRKIDWFEPQLSWSASIFHIEDVVDQGQKAV